MSPDLDNESGCRRAALSNTRCSRVSIGICGKLNGVLHSTQSRARVPTGGAVATHACTGPSRLQNKHHEPSQPDCRPPPSKFCMHPQNSPKSTRISLQKAEIKYSNLPASLQNAKRVRSPQASYVPVVIVAGFDIIALWPEGPDARAESH